MKLSDELFGRIVDELGRYREAGGDEEKKPMKIDFEKLKAAFAAADERGDRGEEEDLDDGMSERMRERFLLLVRIDEVDRLADETDNPNILAYIRRRKKELRAELDFGRTAETR